MKSMIAPLISAAVIVSTAGCNPGGSEQSAAPAPAVEKPSHSAEPDHAHGEVELGAVTIGGMAVAVAQGHGQVAAGTEGHLVVKLPFNDNGSTVVRAWIGIEDRTLSYVGKGTYAASHDDYDVHAMAPDPLPDDVSWWIEIQKPDGTKAVGSIKPLME